MLYGQYLIIVIVITTARIYIRDPFYM